MRDKGDFAAAVRACGFTPRQARFLGLVLEHSGVCLPRQYRTCARLAHGRETHRFFGKLIAGGFATTDLAAPAHAGRLYHLQYKPWYRLLGGEVGETGQSTRPVSRRRPSVVVACQSGPNLVATLHVGASARRKTSAEMAPAGEPAPIANNQYLQLRATTSSSFAADVSTGVTVGTLADTWTLTTAAQDVTPNAFTFADQTGVAYGTLVWSNIVPITGITGSVAAAVSGAGRYRVCGDAGCAANPPFQTTASTLTNGQYVQLQVTSSPSDSTAVTTTLTVGTGWAAWTVTTLGDPCAVGAPAVGTTCVDGSKYAGLTPDGWASTEFAGTDFHEAYYRFITADGQVYVSGETTRNDTQMAPGLWAGLGTTASVMLGAEIDTHSSSAYLQGSSVSTNASKRAIYVPQPSQAEPQQGVIRSTIVRLRQALVEEGDPPAPGSCAAWLATGTNSGVVMLDALLVKHNVGGEEKDGFGHGMISRLRDRSFTSAQENRIAAFKYGANPDRSPVGVPSYFALTFNDNGAFFHATDPSSGGEFRDGPYLGGTVQAQVRILVHELAHLVAVPGFQSDFGNDIAQRNNDRQVGEHCGSLVGGIR